MKFYQAILLGIIQGITEFLPISSSAHLVIIQSLILKMRNPLFFDVMLHFATLVAVLIFLKGEVFFILNGLKENFLKRKFSFKEERFRLLCLVLISSFVTGVIGIFFKSKIEPLFENPETTLFMLMFTGLILYLTKFKRKTKKNILDVKIFDAIILGLAQGLAIIPGVSRSGITISSALFLGINRELSFYFSFLISIPVIFGATILEITEIGKFNFDAVPIILGMSLAFSFGYFSLKYLLRVLKKGKFYYFSYYCLFVSILLISILEGGKV